MKLFKIPINDDRIQTLTEEQIDLMLWEEVLDDPELTRKLENYYYDPEFDEELDKTSSEGSNQTFNSTKFSTKFSESFPSTTFNGGIVDSPKTNVNSMNNTISKEIDEDMVDLTSEDNNFFEQADMDDWEEV